MRAVVFDVMGTMAEGFELDADQLHRMAVEQTGLADFGPRDYTERLGAGDLRLYLIVQFLPLLLLPILLLFYPPRYTHGGNVGAALLGYVLAKILELLDKQVYTAGGLVSGHTLAHVESHSVIANAATATEAVNRVRALLEPRRKDPAQPCHDQQSCQGGNRDRETNRSARRGQQHQRNTRFRWHHRMNTYIDQTRDQ